MKRFFSTLLAVCLLFAGLVVGAAVEDTVARSAPNCPAVYSIAVGGVGDPGALNVPGAPEGSYRVYYPASISPVGGYVSGDESVRIGVAGVNRVAHEMRAQCPDTKITVHGYSLGAVVAENARDQWQNDPVLDHNTSFVVVGSPRQPVVNGYGGAMSVWPTFIPGFEFNGPGNDAGIPISRTCNENDIICNVPANPVNVLGAVNGIVGYITGDHAYTDVYTDGGNHVVQQQPIIPSVPLPDLGTNLYEVLNPITSQIVPDAPISPVYTPTPISAYTPDVIEPFLPPEVKNFVPPPLPVFDVNCLCLR